MPQQPDKIKAALGVVEKRPEAEGRLMVGLKLVRARSPCPGMVHRASCSPKLEPGSTGGVGLSQHSVNRFLLELKAPIIAGKTLIKVGETQRRLGAAERDFIHSASINFLTPLRNFLEGDWRTISVSMVAGKGSLSLLQRGGGQGEVETVLGECVLLPHEKG